MEGSLNDVEIGPSLEKASNQKRSQDRLWKGSVEDMLRNEKLLHRVLKRDFPSTYSDGVFSNKPDDEQKHAENAIFEPLEQQLLMSSISDRSSQLKLEARSEESKDAKDNPPNPWGHDLSSLQLHEVPNVEQQEGAKPKQKQKNPVRKPQLIPTIANRHQNISSTESTENRYRPANRHRPANSTHIFDMGFPTQYNLHDREHSRQHTTAVGLKLDFTYQN